MLNLRRSDFIGRSEFLSILICQYKSMSYEYRELPKSPNIFMSQTFLHVEYREKDEVKCLGAHWNGFQWYVPAGCNLTPFARWLPIQESPAAYRLDEALAPPVQGLSLREVMQRIRGCVQRGLPDALWIRAELTKVCLLYTSPSPRD